MRPRMQTFAKLHRKQRLWEWLVGIFAGFILCGLIFTLWLTPVRMGNSSMYGTIKDGDVVLVNRLHKYFSDIQRGDIIVYRLPRTRELCIKRVIAIGGETIMAGNGDIIINGVFQLEESYAIHAGLEFPTISVSPGCVFALSDNRHFENGAAIRGTSLIPAEDIVGVVRVSLFPFSVFSTDIIKDKSA